MSTEGDVYKLRHDNFMGLFAKYVMFEGVKKALKTVQCLRKNALHKDKGL